MPQERRIGVGRAAVAAADGAGVDLEDLPGGVQGLHGGKGGVKIRFGCAGVEGLALVVLGEQVEVPDDGDLPEEREAGHLLIVGLRGGDRIAEGRDQRLGRLQVAVDGIAAEVVAGADDIIVGGNASARGAEIVFQTAEDLDPARVLLAQAAHLVDETRLALA